MVEKQIKKKKLKKKLKKLLKKFIRHLSTVPLEVTPIELLILYFTIVEEENKRSSESAMWDLPFAAILPFKINSVREFIELLIRRAFRDFIKDYNYMSVEYDDLSFGITFYKIPIYGNRKMTNEEWEKFILSEQIKMRYISLYFRREWIVKTKYGFREYKNVFIVEYSLEENCEYVTYSLALVLDPSVKKKKLVFSRHKDRVC